MTAGFGMAALTLSLQAGRRIHMRNERVVLSIVVPCFNEEEALPVFYDTVPKIIEEMGVTWEFVFVDDGSTDRTLALLRKMATTDRRIRYISFSRNFGKEAGIFAGLQASRGDYVVLMDVDLQDPPSYIPEMYRILQSGEYDNVATRRQTRKGEPPIRSLLSKGFYKTINMISDTPIEDGARDFRMMKRKMVDAILQIGEYNRFSKGLFSWVGFRTYWISYDNVERSAGKTKFNVLKLIRYALEGIENFSDTPLNIASSVGILLTIAAFVWALILMLKKLFIGNYNVSGWTSTICVIIFLGGIQLLSIGIMGQYIAKIFLETKHRPLFIVAETSEDDQGAALNNSASGVARDGTNLDKPAGIKKDIYAGLPHGGE